MNVLECSSKGDKRFSAFYAKIEVFGSFDSIENHYQLSKRVIQEDGSVLVPQTWRDVKGKTSVFFEVQGVRFPESYLSQYYKLLWIKYLDKNPSLVKYASTFDEFNDIFKGKSKNCQADVVKQYVKEGRKAMLLECQPFIKVLNRGGFVIQVDGDLLESKENILGHQTNGLGSMGAGLALAISKKYPEVFEPYEQLCLTHGKKRTTLGMCQLVETQEKGRYIANLFGQHGVSREEKKTEEAFLRKSLEELKEKASERGLSIGLPYELGSGLSGGDWNEIKQIIIDVFDDYPVTIYKLPQANLSKK